MQWIYDFDLFLFDFDGLLVNTEHIHYQAYGNALEKSGYSMPYSFGDFCEFAHLNATAWKEALCAKIPDLEPIWKRIYQEKKEAFKELLSSGKVELMPGVEPLLKTLEGEKRRRCVVTHSPFEIVQIIRSSLPILQTIPHWITREDYEKPKPDPECYLKAIVLYGKPGDKIIGFEDSIRGVMALKKTPALPILICSSHHPLLEMALEKGILHFPSLEKMDKQLP